MRVPLLLLLLAACHSYGARTVPRDRFDYSSAVGKSWKQQMLLNIVKLRYMDAPIFLDVQQILAGYTIEGAGAAGWGQSGSLNPGWSLGASGRFVDRPTITYRPLTGQEFAKNLMTPIPPKAIFYLIQAGYSADLVLPLCVDSINGLRNRSGSISQRRPADEGFRRYVALLRDMQRAGILGMRVEHSEEEKQDVTVIFFLQRNVSPEMEAKLDEMRDLLRLDDERTVIKITYATGPGGGDSIVMLTRSIFTIMFELATQIDVPAEHDAEGQVVPIENDDRTDHAIRVHTSPKKLDDDFVSVEYEDHWFSISKKDLLSKRTFTFLNLLLSFTDTGSPEIPTLVTVPG